MCERLGQVPQSLPGDATQVRAQLASAVGMSLAAPNIMLSGFQFAGGRAFRAANTEAAHLAWTAGTQMISFYQSADPGGDPPPGWRAVRLDGRAFWIGKSNGERAVVWREGGVLYITYRQPSRSRPARHGPFDQGTSQPIETSCPCVIGTPTVGRASTEPSLAEH